MTRAKTIFLAPNERAFKTRLSVINRKSLEIWKAISEPFSLLLESKRF